MADRNFRLTSIEKTPPPEGIRNESWHRYVIENDLTTIYGYARGSRRFVTQHARDYIEQLNAKNDPSKKKGPWVRRTKQKR